MAQRKRVKSKTTNVKYSLADRVVAINGRITPKTLDKVAEALRELQNISFAPIMVIIGKSPGGVALAGMMIYDLLRRAIADVYTIVISQADSAAFQIFLAGKKRIMVRGATVMPHLLVLEYSGYFTENAFLNETKRNYFAKYNGRACQAMSEATGLLEKEANALYLAEKSIGASQARRLNIATKVISPKFLSSILKQNKDSK